MSLYIFFFFFFFCKASRKSLKPFSSYRKYMIWITIDNVQRAVTPKVGKSELWFLYFANCIMVIYICIKFQENISNSVQHVTEWTQIYYRNHYFQSSKGHNSKGMLNRVTVLVFCTSSYDNLDFCEVSSKYLELFSTYRADTST